MGNNINPVPNNQQNPEVIVQPNQNYPYNPYIKPKKIYKPMDKKDIAFMMLFIILSFLLIDFAVCGGFHLGFTVFYFALFAVSTVYLSKQNKKLPVFSALCGVLSLLGSVTFSLYNDYFINTIMFVLIGGLYTVYCLGISDSFNYNQGSFKMLIDMVLSVFAYPFKNMPDLFGAMKASSKKNKKSMNGLMGAAVALPVLVIIIPLLVKSDAAFEGLVTAIGKNIGIYLLELFFALIISPYIFSFAYGRRKSINKHAKSVPDSDVRKLPVSACTSFLSVISITYLVYLFSQLAYFFSAFRGILPSGYEYSASAFARRGFFEMFAICVINISIISLVSMFVKKKSMPVKLLSLFISLFSVLLLVTAMQKMRLNISIFGLSKNRLLVSVFMVMLLVIIAFFIVHIFAPKIRYMQPIIIICSAIFITLSFADIDAQIAKYNINAYESGQLDSLDVEAIANLSDSAVSYTAELISSDDAEISKKSVRVIAKTVTENYGDEIIYRDNSFSVNQYAYDFRQYNYSKSKAINSLCSYLNNLENDKKNVFLNCYNLENSGAYYDEDEDEYYFDDENGYNVYEYNDKTGTYELCSVENT